jgi:threonine synthase
MPFYSTNNKNATVSLKTAVIKGLAPDNGLYMPTEIRQLSQSFFDNIENKSLGEISFEVANALIGKEIDSATLQTICEDAMNFDIPLVQVHDNISSLELYHGPTLAFKDVGARFMARLMSHFVKDETKEVNILVATSGDTGGAVANGFLGVEGINVIILYPKGKVSPLQEKQLTTLGQNITALEIDGTFDDCQKLVKTAFLDAELNAHMKLSSANSINIARLIPQSFYYHWAYKQLKDKSKETVFCVPSGNFGNLTAGVIAKRMGLPIDGFVAATNINDMVPKYLETGVYEPRASQETISNAMDVGAPSNFARLMDFYDNSVEAIKKDFTGYSYTDNQTRETMVQVYNDYNYILDPHGAVGYRALATHLKGSDKNGIFFETAHPAKFIEVVEETLDIKVAIPVSLQATADKTKVSIEMTTDFDAFKSYLKSR